MLILKDYQTEKVKELKMDFIRLINTKRNSSIVFEAPTWSWKTVMIQEFLKQISETILPKKLAFIWISVNDLSNQSKQSFEKNLEWTKLTFLELQDIKNRTLQENEILFINWEKIKAKDNTTWKWKVLAMKDNEKNENIPNYMENSRQNGLEIVLIVDESHKQLNTPKAQELINDYFKPIIQIEVSATPDSQNYDKKISVDINDVIKSWMIKKEVLVNENIDLKTENSTDKLIIKSAIEKQKELEKAYKKNNLPFSKGWPKRPPEGGGIIKPLLLIQLPSESQKTTELDRTKINRVKQILKDDYDITIENQKLAIWLSENKTNKDLINIANSPVEILLFKQAIATGWDCPRAQILVMFREIWSITFEIQTVWRILRMPEQKHYENEILNKAYVYTDIDKNSMFISATAKNIIKNKVAIRKMDFYKPFSLKSNYSSRWDYNDIWSDFYEVFFTYFIENILNWIYKKTINFIEIEQNKKLFEKIIDINDLSLTSNIIKNWKILVDIDYHSWEKLVISDDFLETKKEEELIEIEFDNFCKLNVWPQFWNIARSYRIIKEAIFLLFEKYVLWEDFSRIDIQKLVLKNADKFIEVLHEIKDYYKPIRKKTVEEKLNEKFKNKTWEIPANIWFAWENIEELEVKKYIYTPSYISIDSSIERDFIDYLENQDEVLFWYKNWVNLDIYFWVKYEIDWQSKMFYPDFIVYYKSWIIWIYDTKDWNTLTSNETKQKAIFLEKYVKQDKKSKIISWIIKRIWVWENKYFMINKTWKFDFGDNSNFQIYNDDFVRNYDFDDLEKISPKYRQEIEEKIVFLEKELKVKEKEYSSFIEEQHNYEKIDNEAMLERINEIEEIKKNIFELKEIIF